jgi:hypothetical protein
LTDIPWYTVFRRIWFVFLDKIGQANSTLTFAERLRSLLVIAFSFNPMLIVLWLSVAVADFVGILRKSVKFKDGYIFIAILSFVILVICLIIGANTYGIPKYCYPLTALISIVICFRFYRIFIDSPKEKMLLSFLIICLIALAYSFIDDPLFLMNHELKAQIISGESIRPTIFKILSIYMLFTAPIVLCAVIWFFKKRKVAAVLMFLFIIGQSLGFNARQAFAPYQIAYCYGYQGIDRAYALTYRYNHRFIPEGAIIPPFGYLTGKTLNSMEDGNWALSLSTWKEYIENQSPDVVVCGRAFNTVNQIKLLFGTSEFKIFMEEGYDHFVEADCDVFIKKKR